MSTNIRASARANPTDGRPRVLLVGPFPPTTGGVTTFMLNLTASFASERYEFVPFTTSRPPKKNVTKNWGYGAMLRGGLLRVLAGIVITLWHLAIFPRALRGIDIVQIQASDYQVFWESTLYAIMARALGKPVVFRIGGAFDIFHGGSRPFTRRMIARALRVPDCIVVQSLFARAYVDAIVETKRIVVPNWSREGVSAPRDDREKPDHPVFVFIAGPEAERKGIRILLQAIVRLAREGTPARFRLVAVPGTLASEISGLDLGEIVSTEGTLSRERILDAMEDAHVFLLPSYGEGFPNSLVEAMAAGMASIVTPVGAVPEIIADGGALAAEVGSVDQLTDAIRRLSEDGALRQRLSREAQRTVATRYTAEAALRPLLEQYANLLRARDRAVQPASVLKRIVLIGPVAEPGEPAQGGYQSSNLRLLDVLRTLAPEVEVQRYPEVKGSLPFKAAHYLSRFSGMTFAVLRRSGRESAIHFTPLFRQFIGAELLLAFSAHMRGYKLIIDIRAGSQIFHYRSWGMIYRWLFRTLLKQADFISYEGEAYKTFVETLAPRTPSKLLPNYVKAANVTARKPARAEEAPRLVYVGSVSEAKGVTASARALRVLRQRFPAATLTLVGAVDPQYRAELQRADQDNGFIWAGSLPPAGVWDELERADFFMFLTHWVGEGQSNALTEAMARGCVPIITDHGFNAAVVRCPEFIMHDRDDSEAIADLIARIWETGAWKKYSDAMVSRVAENYTDKQIAAELRQIYGSFFAVTV